LAPDLGAIVRVHPSNFRGLGFVADVEIESLCGLGVAVIDDVGSDVLADQLELLRPELAVRRSVASGAALACFSAEKLLGAARSGLIVDRADPVAACARTLARRAGRADHSAPVTLTPEPKITAV
jgi:L-seryl-tRNA(Ser) seleniumtransferase